MIGSSVNFIALSYFNLSNKAFNNFPYFMEVISRSKQTLNNEKKNLRNVERSVHVQLQFFSRNINISYIYYTQFKKSIVSHYTFLHSDEFCGFFRLKQNILKAEFLKKIATGYPSIMFCYLNFWFECLAQNIL